MKSVRVSNRTNLGFNLPMDCRQSWMLSGRLFDITIISQPPSELEIIQSFRDEPETVRDKQEASAAYDWIASVVLEIKNKFDPRHVR